MFSWSSRTEVLELDLKERVKRSFKERYRVSSSVNVENEVEYTVQIRVCSGSIVWEGLNDQEIRVRKYHPYDTGVEEVLQKLKKDQTFPTKEQACRRLRQLWKDYEKRELSREAREAYGTRAEDCDCIFD